MADSSGKVWIAWQGWRDGRAAIFSAHQDGDGFTSPEKISNSGKNEWDPAIAADNRTVFAYLPGQPGTIVQWDMALGKEIRRHPGEHFALTPDGAPQ